MLFQASILVLYFARMPAWLKGGLTAVTLAVLMPVLGSINGYYLEIAIQVGIFVALALGLNIVVGLAGLLDLGYVAFFAVGAYTWAIFGSPQANQFLPGGIFPLAQGWFFLFLLLGVGDGGRRRHPARPARAAPARRLPRHRDTGLRRGDPRARQQPRQAHQLHERPEGRHPDLAPAHLLRARPPGGRHRRRTPT